MIWKHEDEDDKVRPYLIQLTFIKIQNLFFKMVEEIPRKITTNFMCFCDN